ncbi:MAG: glycosyltransferase [Candidatus Sumerlaeia bacterium]|nr:glycosyltransferase [Candidatus Sumerlaeia bacterium]
MKKQLILVCVQYFHEDKMGGFRRAADLLKMDESVTFQKHFEFRIPSHRVDGTWATRTGVWKNVEPVAIPSKWARYGKWGLFIRYNLEYAREMLRFRNQLSAVYVVAPPSWWFLGVLPIGLLLNIPIVLDLGDSARSQSKSVSSYLLHFISEMLFRALSDKVVLASKRLRIFKSEFILESCAPNNQSISLNLSIPNQSNSGDATQKKFIYAGTLGVLQDIPSLLDFWSRINAIKRNYKLTIVGWKNDSTGKDIMRLFKNKYESSGIEILPFYAPEKVAEFVSASDWGIVSLADDRKLDYALPTKLLDYIGSGLPVIAIGGKEVSDFLNLHNNGVYIKSSQIKEQNVEALLTNIERNEFSYRINSLNAAKRYFKKERYLENMRVIISSCKNKLSETIIKSVNWLKTKAMVKIDINKKYFVGLLHSTSPSRIINGDKWVYLEITAYQISLYIQLYRISGNREYLILAEKLCLFVCFTIKRNNSLPFIFDISSKNFSQMAWSFDLAMAIRAMNLYLRIKYNPIIHKYRNLALCQLMEFQKEDGSFYAAKDHFNTFIHDEDTHYSNGCALHIKHLLCLEETDYSYGFEDVEASSKASIMRSKILKWLNENFLRRNENCFHINPKSNDVFFHTNIYAMEGLSIFYDFQDINLKCLRWLYDIFIKYNLFLPRGTSSKDCSFLAGDATGQFYRILCYYKSIAHIQSNSFLLSKVVPQLNEVRKRIHETQSPHGFWPESPNLINSLGQPVWVTQLTLSGILMDEFPTVDHWMF